MKYAIEPKGSDGFFLAGIYRMETGKPVFTVLTRNAAEDIAFIHERIPVILPNEAAVDWLNPKYHGDDILKEAQLDMKYTAC
ncbi:MAG: SOS response-associated peptidase family protein [Faecousia sp.]